MASVTISQEGRSGGVRYAEGLRAIEGYWEFGGGDAIAIIAMGSREDFAHRGLDTEAHGRILRFIADEVIRQRAPGCVAEIDEERGDIVLRQRGASTAEPPAQAEQALRHERAATFVRRFARLKAVFALAALAFVLVAGGLFWSGRKLFLVAPASGVPTNDAARFEAGPSTAGGVASFIATTDPHPPRWSGRGGEDKTTLSILIIPSGEGQPRLVTFARGVTSSAYVLARILGSDGRTLWFDAAGFHGVRLDDFRLIGPKELAAANPGLDTSWWADARGMDIVEGRLRILRDDNSAAVEIDPVTLSAAPAAPKLAPGRFDRVAPADFLSAGLVAGNNAWIGFMTEEEASQRFSTGEYVRRVEPAETTDRMRALRRAQIEAASDEKYLRIRSIAPAGVTLRNAAFLRLDATSEPLRLTAPDGVLVAHTAPAESGDTLLVSRMSLDGEIVWTADTGLHRFGLRQILPAKNSFAFVGERPPIPDKLSEPLVVFVDNASGKVTHHSLWR